MICNMFVPGTLVRKDFWYHKAHAAGLSRLHTKHVLLVEYMLHIFVDQWACTWCAKFPAMHCTDRILTLLVNCRSYQCPYELTTRVMWCELSFCVIAATTYMICKCVDPSAWGVDGALVHCDRILPTHRVHMEICCSFSNQDALCDP